jgi:hypothetical protein
MAHRVARLCRALEQDDVERRAASNGRIPAYSCVDEAHNFRTLVCPRLLAKEKRSASIPCVALRTCTVSCRDSNGVEHAVEVTAQTLYEAAARGLRIFRENDWVSTVEQSALAIKVRQPEVEHRIRIRDFERWLTSAGKSPAEQAIKSGSRDLFKDRVDEKSARRT